MIPLLPCVSIDENLDFYLALDFEVTFYQKSPYSFAAVQRGGIELQFFGMSTHDPKESYHSCYVVTDEVDSLYESFRAGLKATLGKIPTRGLPRIGALKNMSYGVRQFLMTDPGGNGIRIGQPIAESFEHTAVPKERYARALHQATLLGESKGDHAAAARIIDRALSAAGTPTPVQFVSLLVLRAEMSAQLGDAGHTANLLARVAEVELTDQDRELTRDVLRRAEDLAQQIA